MTFPKNNLPLDSDSERDNTLFNLKGSDAMIEQFPEWKGFTVEQYFKQYWAFIYTKKLHQIDDKYFWIRFSDEYREEPDIFNPNLITKRRFAAKHLLICHLIESFKDTPEQLGAFFRKMLFYTPKYGKKGFGAEYLDSTQTGAIGFLYSKTKPLGIYHEYIRPHLYDLLNDFEQGNPETKRKSMYILVLREKEIQSYFTIKKYLLHPDGNLRFDAGLTIDELNSLYPYVDRYKL